MRRSDRERPTVVAKEPEVARDDRPVLITGGAGFIGCNVAHRLLAAGHRVMLYDTLARSGVEQNVAWLRETHGDRVEAVIADVRDADSLRRAVARASRVFHFAAQVAVTTSLEDPLDDFGVNVGGTLRLLEALRGTRTPLLFTSTNKVYGSLVGVPLHPVSEDRPLDFCTPYGCSKGAADQYVLDYAHSFGLPTVVFRMSCIYGPHQHGNEDQGWVAHFVLQALRGGRITIYGDGKQVRDVLYVDDLVDAMLGAIGRDGEVFNVGGGPENAVSLLELLALIGVKDVDFEPERPGDQRWYVSDTTKLQRTIGWRPRVGVADGVAALQDWLARERLKAAA
jgi:CDP-paratose 2-epimerase